MPFFNPPRTLLKRIPRMLVLVAVVLGAGLVAAQDDPPPAEIINDEGGPVVVTGEMEYTNPLLVMGIAQPLIILEDQAGFVDRDRGFLMPPESQVLGQFTSNFFTSPAQYSIALPIEPQGTYRDVDQDDEAETGVQIYAVAFWSNIFGDPFLEERDLQGGGWSTAYASTRISDDADTPREVVGGKLLIYAPDDEQGFPSGFGADGLLFTEDDPVVTVPQGYTVVDLDSEPFTFDRSAAVDIDTIEPERAALDDFSTLSYTDAFDAMIDKLRREYAFTEYKGIDWDALSAEFRPRIEQAEADGNALEFRVALRDLTLRIPDGHVSGPAVREVFDVRYGGGLGLAMRELDDGRVLVNYLTPGGPAETAGIELRAEILELNETPIDEALDATEPPITSSTEHSRRWQQLRYSLRYPVDTEVELTFRNPGDDEPTTATLTAADEVDSFRFSSLNRGRTGTELPVEFEILPEGYGYVSIYSFSDNELLTVQLWERAMQTFNQVGVAGVIVDMRQNSGGSGFLADQMAAYFFDAPLELGNTAFYDEDSGEFFADPDLVDRFYLPAPSLRYLGPVAVIAGPNCNSACEFFTYNMTLQDRAAIVGYYPTAGLGGSIAVFLMPENEFIRFTSGRALDASGEIHIEGLGVAPTIDVPVTEETMFSEGDPLLDAAVDYLDEQSAEAAATTS